MLCRPITRTPTAAATTMHRHAHTLARRLLVPKTAGVHSFYSSFFVRWNLWTGPFCVATQAFTPLFGSQVGAALAAAQFRRGAWGSRQVL